MFVCISLTRRKNATAKLDIQLAGNRQSAVDNLPKHMQAAIHPSNQDIPLQNQNNPTTQQPN